jgi:Fis family transcriptional regulator, factor for inversion stimulation protein
MSDLIATALSDEELQSLPLSEFVTKALENYFEHLEGECPKDLYQMVIREVEKSLFKVIMKKAKGNQSLATNMCGLARGTLRKKLKEYQLD